MTDARSKVNAIFLSVLMVLSVVAIGGAAPAAAQQATVVEDTVETDGSTVTINHGGANAVGVEAFTPDTVELSDASDGGTISSDGIVWNGPSGDTVTFTLTPTGTSVGDTVQFDVGAGNGSTTVTLDVVESTSDGGDGSDGSDGSDGTVDAPRETIDDNVYVPSGQTVFQGEEDLTFANSVGDTVPASSLSGTSGNREGTPLQMPIPQDEETGTYDLNGPDSGDGGFSTTVVEPRITTSEVRLNDEDIDQIASSRANPDNGLNIYAEWNFGVAEDLEVSVEDPSGSEITNEVLTNGDEMLEGGEESVGLDLSTEDAGEYTVIFEGNDNLDYDGVVQEYTITTTSQDSVEIEMAEDSVTQGDNVQYTVSGGTNADFHTVVVDSSDFRDEVTQDTAERIFRNVEDVEETGVTTDAAGDFDYAYATVEIDGTTALGSINTGGLDDSTIDVDVYEAQGSSTTDISGLESVDDTSFDVEEGEITLDSPTGEYTIGSEADINGTAASADEVAIYARDNNEWEMLDIDGDGSIDDDDFISVDSDDSFEEEDVNLREASNILAFEGNYGIGAVDVADLSDDPNEYAELDNSEFSSASSVRETLTAQGGDLTANFGTVNGQIADDIDEDIDVDGTASGQDTVVVAFVGQRGDTYAQEISVDSDDTFEEDDIPLTAISQGAVSGHVISPARDGQFGDGGDWGSASDVVSQINDGFGSSTGDQIRSQILANTVDETGSDDLIVSTTFRINDPTLSVNNVYPEGSEASGLNPVATGETVVVEGDTNRQSDNAAITVELLTQDENSVLSTSVDEWESDGQWSVTMDTSDVETGTYIVEADDSESTDRVTVEIVEERDTSDGEDGSDDGSDGSSDGEDGSDDGSDGSSDGEDGSDDGSDGSSDGEDGGSDGGDGGSTDDGTPGFGALVALVALVAAALLATRRDN